MKTLWCVLIWAKNQFSTVVYLFLMINEIFKIIILLVIMVTESRTFKLIPLNGA